MRSVGRRLACEHSMGIMELEVQVLLICSQSAWIFLVLTMGLLYIWANNSCCVFAAGGRPLSRTLAG